jgi:hypothetical protein
MDHSKRFWLPLSRRRRWIVLAATAAVVTLLAAACSGGGHSSTSGQSSSGAVTGTTTWPNGDSAAGAKVYFLNYDPSHPDSGLTDGWSEAHSFDTGLPDPNGRYSVQNVSASGTYSLRGCPCSDLTAYLFVPGTSGASPDNGGQDCWIIMQDSGNYQGVQADPGTVINWRAEGLPCSSTGYPSDNTLQNIQAGLVPNSGDAYSGPWQAAEQRTSGSG